MKQHLWAPLGIESDVSFWPEAHPAMMSRLADMSTLDGAGCPPAMDSNFDLLYGAKDCLGGGGVAASCNAFFTFVSAVFRWDARLLNPASYVELFRPQLNDDQEQAFNEYLYSSPEKAIFLPLGIPASARKTWSLAGIVCLDGQEGRFGKGSTLWAGVPCVTW